MLWLTVFVAIVVSLAIVLYVIRPLIDRSAASIFVENDRLSDLLSRKDAVLRAIKDLEFDRQVGKLDESDFERFNQNLGRQAVGLIQQIEKIAPASSQQDDILEQEITRLRKTVDKVAPRLEKIKPAPAPKTQPSQLSPTIKPRFCTECGQPAAVEHKFCANCGAALV